MRAQNAIHSTDLKPGFEPNTWRIQSMKEFEGF